MLKKPKRKKPKEKTGKKTEWKIAKNKKKEEKIGGPHPYARGCRAPGEGATDRVLAFLCCVCPCLVRREPCCVLLAHLLYFGLTGIFVEGRNTF